MPLGPQVNRLHDGECFGELALLSGAPRNATITCASKSCRLLSMDVAAFTKLMKRSTALQKDISLIAETRRKSTPGG